VTERNQQKILQSNLVGLLPAGGVAKRVDPLPCSKEIYPVGFHATHRELLLRPKVVGHYLLEKMQKANVTKAYIILRKGKWDIPAYFGCGSFLGIHLAYLMMDLPFGVPYTLDQAYPFVQNATVVFGFPDIIFGPDEAFVKLLDQQKSSGADMVLGLFAAHQPQKMDMVDLDDHGRVRRIEIKPAETKLRYTWIIAVWTPKFTHYMHEFIMAGQRSVTIEKPFRSNKVQKEVFLGDVIQAAVDDDFTIDSVLFPNGNYLDIGTPEDLVKSVEAMNPSRGACGRE
jgi:glucose-1-phosphate thymidylyltransferase